MIAKGLKKGFTTAVLALCAGLFISSAHSNTKSNHLHYKAQLSVIEKLESAADDRFSTFLTALQVAGLYEDLQDTHRKITVFAPNNSAFAALGQSTIDGLLANPDALREVLRYHILDKRIGNWYGCWKAGANGGSFTVQAITSEDISISCTNSSVLTVNSTTVLPPELYVNNYLGVIHEIGNVLTAPNTQQNVAPVAQADTFGPLVAGMQSRLQVLTNDQDADGNLDPASIMILQQPMHGTAVPQSDGTVLYTHNGMSGTGSDTFTYTVKDTLGAVSNEVVVTISPINDPAANIPPVARDDSPAPIGQGGSTGPIQVLSNDSDSDGTIDPGSLIIVRQPGNGTATVENGTITYVNNGRGSTSDSFDYVVRDDDGASSNTATVTIVINTPSNVPPVAFDDSYGPFDQNSTQSLPVTSNDADEDGVIVPGTIVITAQPMHGRASVVDGQIVYVNYGTNDTSDIIKYVVKDNDGATSNEATVTITLNTPPNIPPIAVDDSFGPLNQGSSTSLPVTANDTDPDGAVVSSTIVITSQPANGTASVVNGQILYVNDANGALSDVIKYTVKDNDGAVSNEATVTITLTTELEPEPKPEPEPEPKPENQAPVAVDDTFGPFEQGTTQSLGITHNDFDEDGVIVPSTIVIISQPMHGTATVSNGQIIYVNNGSGALTDTLTYTVQDDDGATSNVATVTINLIAPQTQNIPPVAVDDVRGPLAFGSNIVIDILTNDSDVDGTLDTTSVNIISGPANGSVQVQGDGTVVYTNNGQPGNGTDSFTYTVRDNDGAVSNVATVSIFLDDGMPGLNIVDLLISKGNYTTLVELLEITGLANTLRNTDDRFTVFAPADEVFALLGEDTINALRADTNSTRNILLYHVLGGQAVDVITLCNGAPRSIIAASGEELTVTCTDIETFINSSRIVSPDNIATNGIVHGIEPLLSPPDVAPQKTLFEVIRDDGNFNTLTGLLITTGLDVVLGDAENEFTVFAPNDAAFANLEQATLDELTANPDLLLAVLQYHVIGDQTLDAASLIALDSQSIVTINGDSVSLSVTGGTLFVNDSQVVRADIFAVNGVAHAIDGVLIPDSMGLSGDSLWDLIASDDRFSKLRHLLLTHGLDEKLRNLSAQYTAFLPNNDAFHYVAGKYYNELKSNKSKAEKFLDNHLVPNTSYSVSDLIAEGTVDTSFGTTLTIKTHDGRTYVKYQKSNSLWWWKKFQWVHVQIKQADLTAVNGTAHSINYPLLP